MAGQSMEITLGHMGALALLLANARRIDVGADFAVAYHYPAGGDRGRSSLAMRSCSYNSCGRMATINGS